MSNSRARAGNFWPVKMAPPSFITGTMQPSACASARNRFMCPFGELSARKASPAVDSAVSRGRRDMDVVEGSGFGGTRLNDRKPALDHGQSADALTGRGKNCVCE